MSVPFQSIPPAEAIQVVEAVLINDPSGTPNCLYCQHSNRKQIDLDLLTQENLADVVEHHKLASRANGEQWAGKEFSRVCGLIEKHRRYHIIKPFEKLTDESNFPDATAPTVHFLNWAVQEHYNVLHECSGPRDRMKALQGMVAALKVRAEVRGEMEHSKNRPSDVIETEALLSPEQQRKALELAAKKLGLKLVEAKQQLAIEIQ